MTQRTACVQHPCSMRVAPYRMRGVQHPAYALESGTCCTLSQKSNRHWAVRTNALTRLNVCWCSPVGSPVVCAAPRLTVCQTDGGYEDNIAISMRCSHIMFDLAGLGSAWEASRGDRPSIACPPRAPGMPDPQAGGLCPGSIAHKPLGQIPAVGRQPKPPLLLRYRAILVRASWIRFVFLPLSRCGERERAWAGF
jgi:hypothetical protein